jgi:hypothetical protein
MASELGWNEETLRTELAAFESEVGQYTAPA